MTEPSQTSSHSSKTSDVVVRLAEPGDHVAIRDLFYEGLHEGHIRNNDTGADIEHLQAGYFDDDEQSGFWVADLQGQIIGMIGVQRTSSDTAEVRRLRVHPEYRRRGIGTRLMEQALSFCKHHSYLKVILDVRIDRAPAIALFEKFGFAHARTRENDGRPTLEFYLDIYREPRG